MGKELQGGQRLTCVSLFSGGMGLDLGLESVGFDLLLAADNMPAAVATIRQNRPSLPVFSGDISALHAEQVYELSGLRPGELDVLAGGPPCQSFSTAGRRRGLEDGRNGPLLFEFVRLIEELRPRAFLIENVKGLLSASVKWRALPYNNNGVRIDEWHGSMFRELKKRIHDLGYSFGYMEVDAADYGVPQHRLRVIVVGYRDAIPVSFPDITHSKGGGLLTRPWRTIHEVLRDLDGRDGSYCTKFSPRKLKYLRMVPPGGNWRDLPEDIQEESMGRAFFAKGGRCGYWRRLSFDEPAPTILTEPQNASTSLCHPTEDRPLTVRECARIQTFPDDWEFVGRGAEQYRLVGNAVPVLLAQAIGAHIRKSLLADSGRLRVATC